MTIKEYAQKLTELPAEVQDMDMDDIEVFFVDTEGELLLIPKSKK